MARLEEVEVSLEIRGGNTPSSRDPIRIRINGHILPLTFSTIDEERGLFEGKADIHSVVHSLELLGPRSGRYDIAVLKATFHMADGKSYGNELRDVAVGTDESVDIWTVSDSFSV